MPIYEYRCVSCGHRFDVLQRMSDDGSKLTCPRCGAEKPQRMISACASSIGSASFDVPTGGSCAGGCCCGN
ncbi:MAG: zinc ribbon domain-containing protein [candidate division KSB1 bacterium]|nr:zinc ribbon domain-containing protein [candidate division KSB1 bacterium]